MQLSNKASQSFLVTRLTISCRVSRLGCLKYRVTQPATASYIDLQLVSIAARVVLAILAFTLFVVVQITRVNINIAVVVLDNTTSIPGLSDKAIILGSFYWCYWMTELPGAYLAQRYGSRMVLAVSILASGLGSLVFPMAYCCHPICAAFVRAFQGLAMGTTWPAMATMSARWIPKNERSKFMSTYQGASVGASLTNALGGVILAQYDWQYLFYGTGILSIGWTLVWWLCAFDTPAQHPRISSSERQYLADNICHVVQTKHFTPWRNMLTSTAFWAVLLATLGLMWSVITLAMQLPSYLDQVHHVDIKTNGLLLSVPDICKFMFGLKFSSLVDNCIKDDKISISRARKIAVVFSHFLPAILLFFLALYGHYNITVAITLIITTITIGGASASGTISNIVDISPNNAGIIMGTVKTSCVIPGILSPILVQYFSTCEQQNWPAVFASLSVILAISCAIFLVFGSGNVQYWDQSAIHRNLEEPSLKETTAMVES